MLFIQQRVNVVRGAKGRDALVCGCPGARDGDGVAAARHDSIIMGDVGRSAARVRGSCQASAACAFRRGVRGLLAALEGHVGGALNDRSRGVLDGDGLIAGACPAAVWASAEAGWGRDKLAVRNLINGQVRCSLTRSMLIRINKAE